MEHLKAKGINELPNISNTSEGAYIPVFTKLQGLGKMGLADLRLMLGTTVNKVKPLTDEKEGQLENLDPKVLDEGKDFFKSILPDEKPVFKLAQQWNENTTQKNLFLYLKLPTAWQFNFTSDTKWVIPDEDPSVNLATLAPYKDEESATGTLMYRLDFTLPTALKIKMHSENVGTNEELKYLKAEDVLLPSEMPKMSFSSITFRDGDNNDGPHKTVDYGLHFQFPKAWDLELIRHNIVQDNGSLSSDDILDPGMAPEFLLDAEHTDDTKRWTLHFKLPKAWDLELTNSNTVTDEGDLIAEDVLDPGVAPQFRLESHHTNDTKSYDLHFKMPTTEKVTITKADDVIVNPGTSPSISFIDIDPENKRHRDYEVAFTLPNPWGLNVTCDNEVGEDGGILEADTLDPNAAPQLAFTDNSTDNTKSYNLHLKLPTTEKVSIAQGETVTLNPNDTPVVHFLDTDEGNKRERNYEVSFELPTTEKVSIDKLATTVVPPGDEPDVTFIDSEPENKRERKYQLSFVMPATEKVSIVKAQTTIAKPDTKPEVSFIDTDENDKFARNYELAFTLPKPWGLSVTCDNEVDADGNILEADTLNPGGIPQLAFTDNSTDEVKGYNLHLKLPTTEKVSISQGETVTLDPNDTPVVHFLDTDANNKRERNYEVSFELPTTEKVSITQTPTTITDPGTQPSVEFMDTDVSNKRERNYSVSFSLPTATRIDDVRACTTLLEPGEEPTVAIREGGEEDYADGIASSLRNKRYVFDFNIPRATKIDSFEIGQFTALEPGSNPTAQLTEATDSDALHRKYLLNLGLPQSLEPTFDFSIGAHIGVPNVEVQKDESDKLHPIYHIAFDNLKGKKGDSGEPFIIRKTYSTIDEMNADYDTSQVELGQFAIISNATDYDNNSKVFMRCYKTAIYETTLGYTGPDSQPDDLPITDTGWLYLAKMCGDTPVTGVKGNIESTYRTGDINITPEDVGALPIDGGTMEGVLNLIDSTPVNANQAVTKSYVDTQMAAAGKVQGIKGNAEGSYRTGNVNLTPANIGAMPTTGGRFTGSVTGNKGYSMMQGYVSGSSLYLYTN